MTVYEYKFSIRIKHFSCVLQQMKSLKAENEKLRRQLDQLRRQLDQDKSKSSEYILALQCRDLAIPFGFSFIRLISAIKKPASCVA